MQAASGTLAQPDFNFVVFVACLNWLGTFVRQGGGSVGTRLNALYQNLLDVLPKQAKYLLLLNTIDSILLKCLPLSLLLWLVNRCLTQTILDCFYLFMFLLLVQGNDLFYRVTLYSLALGKERRKYYRSNLVLVALACTCALIDIMTKYWLNIEHMVLLYSGGILLGIAYFYNVFMCLYLGSWHSFRAEGIILEERKEQALQEAHQIFSRLYHVAKKYTGRAHFSFAFAKEFTQIIMEKMNWSVNLFYGSCLVLLVITPIVRTSNKAGAGMVMCLCAMGYFAWGTTVSFSAREFNSKWILRIYNIKYDLYFYGKLMANITAAIIGSTVLYAVYRIMLYIWFQNNVVWPLMLWYGCCFAVPLGSLWGIIWGNYVMPQIKYYDNNIFYDYSEGSMGHVYIFFITRFIELPVRKLLFERVLPFYFGITILMVYIFILFFIAKGQTKKKLFQYQ